MLITPTLYDLAAVLAIFAVMAAGLTAWFVLLYRRVYE